MSKEVIIDGNPMPRPLGDAVFYTCQDLSKECLEEAKEKGILITDAVAGLLMKAMMCSATAIAAVVLSEKDLNNPETVAWAKGVMSRVKRGEEGGA